MLDMPTDESTSALARPLHLAYASGTNVLSSAEHEPLAGSSTQSSKRGRQWLDQHKDDNPRPRMLLFDDSARRLEGAADLPVAASPSTNTISNATLHDHTSRGEFLLLSWVLLAISLAIPLLYHVYTD